MIKLSNLRVFYGFSKLNKIMKKPELQIIFENDGAGSDRNDTSVKKWMHIVYIRKQTQEESTDAEGMTRMFTKYGYFINEKPFYGDINKVLEQNFYADENHVSEDDRLNIKEQLLTFYNRTYSRIINQKPL